MLTRRFLGIIIGLICIEALLAWGDPRLAVLAYTMIFVCFLIGATVSNHPALKQALYSLSFIPLMRFIAIGLPLNELSVFSWNLAVGVVLITGVVPFRVLRGSPAQPQTRHWIKVTAVIASAVLFGIVRYLILRPEPVLTETVVERLVFIVGVFLFGGVLEGYLFHGIIRSSLAALLPRYGTIVLMVLLISGLQLGFGSGLYIIFAAVQTLFYSLFVSSNLNPYIAFAYGMISLISMVMLPALA